MSLRAAVLATVLAAPGSIFAAVVDPAEPPATPAGGTPAPSITAGTVVGVAILVGAAAALAGGRGKDAQAPASTTGSGSGTR